MAKNGAVGWQPSAECRWCRQLGSACRYHDGTSRFAEMKRRGGTLRGVRREK